MESQTITKAKEGWLIKRQEELNRIFGSEIPYIIDWDSFAGDEKGINNFEFNGAHQVSAAFRILCNKDENKKLVNRIIKKISLANVKDSADKGISLESGTLKIVCAFATIPAGKISDRDIREFVENIMKEQGPGAEVDGADEAPIKTEWLSRRQEELNSIAGTEILYEINRESFSCDQKGTDNLEFNGAHQVSAAFRILCRKDEDKKLIADNIKKIRLKNVKDISDKRISFSSGVLELACAFAQIPNGRFADREIREFIAEMLRQGPAAFQDSKASKKEAEKKAPAKKKSAQKKTLKDEQDKAPPRSKKAKVGKESPSPGASSEKEQIRQALAEFLTAVSSGDMKRFIASIKPFRDDDVFGPVFAMFSFEVSSFAAMCRKHQDNIAANLFFLMMSALPDPEDAAHAKITNKGNKATAKMADSNEFRLEKVENRWVVDYPGKPPEDYAGPDNYEDFRESFSAITVFISEARKKIKKGGAVLDSILEKLQEMMSDLNSTST